MKHPLLKRGARGPEVVVLQSLIGAVPDGIFGAQTEALLRIVQRARGLDPDGKCGPLTWSRLLDEPDAPEQKGIDVSSYSGLQDFAAHRAAGARFLIVRLTVGTSNDALAKVLLQDAGKAGFEQFGAYGYLRGNEPADEQADALAGRAGEVEAELGIKLATFIDVEDRNPPSLPWPRELYAETAVEALARLRKTRKTGTYIGPWMAALLRKVRDLSPLAEGSLWVSDYSPPVNPIQEWPTWDLWQYRGGDLDWNLFRGDRSEWETRFLGSPSLPI
jgi:GH25 family lysozyme M1 (1,4-beta-N-acetylmuramidase)